MSKCCRFTLLLLLATFSGCEKSGPVGLIEPTSRPYLSGQATANWGAHEQSLSGDLTQSYMDSLEDSQELWRLNLAMGNIHHDRGQVSRAEAFYAKAALLNPSDPGTQRKLAQAAFTLGHYDEAVDAYAAALMAEPDDVDLIAGYVKSLLATGQAARAMPMAERYAQLAENDSAAWLCLAQARTMVGQYESAITAYEQAQAIAPLTYDMQIGLGEAYMGAGRLTESEAAFRQSLDMQNSALGHERLALVLTRQGKHDEAVAEYEAAIIFDDTMTSALNGLALCLAREYYSGSMPNRPLKQRAIALLQQSLKIDGRQIQALELLGHLHKH